MLTAITEELSKDVWLLSVKVPCSCIEQPDWSNPESRDEGSLIGVTVHIKDGKVASVIDTSNSKTSNPMRNGIDFKCNVLIPLFSDLRVYLGRL